jgi:hypothetical protein
MKRISAILFIASMFANFAFGQTSTPAQPKERERWPDGTFKWTTADSVAIRGFGPVARLPYANASLPVAVPSPDGRYFQMMSWRGGLTCGCTRAELMVFDTQAVRRWLDSDVAAPPVPLRTVPMSTRGPGGTALQNVAWDSDSSLVFVGRDGADMEQYFRLDVPSGKLRQLTKESASSRKLGLFTANLQGRTILFWRMSRALPADAEGAPTRTAPMMVAAPRDAEGRIRVLKPGAVSEWVAVHGDGEPWTLPVGAMSVLGAWFVPDGRRAVLMPDKTMPSAQDGFFVLADFVRRKTQVLSEAAPGGRGAAQPIPGRPRSPVAARALWTADESEVILVNAKLPAGQAPAGAPVDTGYIAAYDLATGRWRVLEAIKPKPATGEPKIRAIGWLDGGKELLVAREVDGKPVEGTVYSRSGDTWAARTVAASINLPAAPRPKPPVLPDGLKITMRQSANDPPVLIASDGTREKTMFGPDPALQGLGIVRVEPYKWRMPDGTEQRGQLALPRDFVKGNKTLPLIIQNGQLSPDVFLPDGSVPTGYSRQALVSQGFAVLEVGLGKEKDENGRDLPADTREGPRFVGQIDTAVEALARDGIVDPTRVGALGHSRRGFQIYYAITHPGRVKLSAAEVWDSWTGDYPSYLDRVSRHADPLTPAYERIRGGSFWQNKASWLEHEVLFNVDRVEAATLFVDSSYSFDDKHPNRTGRVPLHPWMTIGAFELNRRPMEYTMIPEAGHVIPGAPFHKAAMDLNVDWMNFWIQGREDPDPAKAEQYKRWRMIRQKNEQRKAEEAKTAKGR